LPKWQETLVELRERFPAASAGFAATLRALQAALPEAPFAVYVDRLDVLQAGPLAGGDPGSWRPGAAQWWRELETLTEEGILVVCSTRYAAADMTDRAHVGMPPLSASDTFRMMGFFVELADLLPDERRKLADWSEGHPLTIETLERTLTEERQRRGLGYECSDPWRELVEAALPRVDATIVQSLRIDDLWACLPEQAREHAARIADTGKLCTLAEIDQLGRERDTLVRCGLLVRHLREVRGTDCSFRWTELWGLPRVLRQQIAGDSSND
jgi:hypothetical protein